MRQSDSPEAGDKQAAKEPVPWLWLGAGILLTVLGCAAGWFLLSGWLLQPPPAAGPAQPTLIVLTAPPSPTMAPTSSAAPPTPIPTFTPIPTPDVALAPSAVTIGFYAQVAGTDDLGLTVRGGPSTRNVVVTVVNEGEALLILDGPQEAENFQWWQVRLQNGLEGWAVDNFLQPVAAPEWAEE